MRLLGVSYSFLTGNQENKPISFYRSLLFLHSDSVHPVGYVVNMKEIYKNMLLKHIQYTKYNLEYHGDLKVMAVLLGMQLSYTK